MKIYNIILIMILGCTSLSVDDRMNLAMKCGTGNECDLLWNDYDKAAERLDRRKAKRAAGKCGKGRVLFCNANCNASRRKGEMTGICIPRESINMRNY